MAARKLQTEIDRTLKKVAEGVELFESIYEKMQASTNQTQKEKLETDLKTQIKKLQRLRDQIKAWVASNDIKDKSALLENRRLIETQMEKFKACEKEMKTKAFSKEGLIQSAKLDPKALEKQEVTLWLQTQVEELLLQVEQAEAEIESLQGTGKKRGKGASSTAGRLDDLEHLNERRKWHVSRLEIILRLLDNGSLSTERVLSLKEDVSYFVDSNTNEDFDEYEGIYDELNLEEEEEKFGLAADDDDDSDESQGASEDLPPRTPSKKHDRDEESVSSSKRDESPILKKATTLQLRKASIATDTVRPQANFTQQPMASILKAGLPAPRPPATLRYATAAAAAVTPSTPSAVTSSSSNTQSTPPTAVSNPGPPTPTAPSITSSTSHLLQDRQLTSSPSLTHPSVTSPMLSSASASHQQDGSFYSGQDSPALSEAVPSSVSGPAESSPQRAAYQKESSSSPVLPRATSPSAAQALAADSQQRQANGTAPPEQISAPSQPPTQAQPTAPSPLPQQVQQAPLAAPGAITTPASTSSMAPQQPQYPPGVKVLQSAEQQPSLLAPQQQPSIGSQRPPSAAPTQQQTALTQSRSTPSSAFPGSLSDLVASFETVKQKATHRMTNLSEVHKMLEGGYSNVPQPHDTEKPKYYVPRNPFTTPNFYPQTPNPVLSTPGIFSQIDVETLFYVFYYLPGTYQQYLAAKELKRQSWRFHVKYLTWFQRHSEPQAITEEYEQGVYVYFDWEGSWCQRKKADFRFEYRYLSED
ncbi:Not1 N-terminal domain, CCR4-Not complex component-domain-containing protein [Hygrophoropsis aurantiaca]|uniref:Not1 N-terminal domain, CCR4-Not complex component-domain-containing protein n=1 Tax=Hygrophoropsis aurantiaca TaxID=72124 RepID=A0ACB8ATV0_9AGAM|nr:Not1 N-terminal domain, CCR4-Not complex component-domain-containing protein [Hygrophoropsis aurantiaca]